MPAPDLYTSLTQLKMAMNDGQLPPMTPLTERAKLVVRPEYTIGMGALREDADRGLQCPVCGAWHRALATHIAKAHKSIGGTAAIRAALGIHPRTALLTNDKRATLRAAFALNAPFIQENLRKARATRPGALTTTVARERSKASLRMKSHHVNVRNMRDTCEAQLKHKFIDLANEIGRSPSIQDFSAKYGEAMSAKVRRLYGSWAAAKSHFGYEVYGRGGRNRCRRTGIVLDAVSVSEGLRSWHAAHGRLPTAREAAKALTLPLLHDRRVYLRVFKTDSWQEAMERAASILQIYGGKYGIPEHLRPKAAA